jgi:hypothetical protein
MNGAGIWDVSNQTFKQMMNGSTNGFLFNNSNYRVSAMVMDNSNSILYVGGNFTYTNQPLNVNYLTYCNINGRNSQYVFKAITDSSGSTGLNGPVNALSIDISNNLLYIGGNFSKNYANTITLYCSAIWNISTSRYSPLEYDNYFSASVNALTFDSSNNNLYIGGTFSFFFSHHISTMEGGMVVTDDLNLYETLKSTRAHGWVRDLPMENTIMNKGTNAWENQFKFVIPGYNLRPLEIEAAIGREQIRKLDAFIDIRRKNADFFLNYANSTDSFIFQKQNGDS